MDLAGVGVENLNLIVDSKNDDVTYLVMFLTDNLLLAFRPCLLRTDVDAEILLFWFGDFLLGLFVAWSCRVVQWLGDIRLERQASLV